MSEVKKSTIIRTIILVVALVNQILVMCGKSIIPITDEEITELVSLVFTIVAALVAWWKNNSYTPAAIAGDEVKDRLKETSGGQ